MNKNTLERVRPLDPSDITGHLLQVCKEIRKQREARKIPREVLAIRSMVCNTTLSQIESGCSIPTLKTLFRIANGLGVEAFTLLLPQGKILL
jgi:transcriptional regulator with XRE-family HTH domain